MGNAGVMGHFLSVKLSLLGCSLLLMMPDDSSIFSTKLFKMPVLGMLLNSAHDAGLARGASIRFSWECKNCRCVWALRIHMSDLFSNL